MPHAQARMEHLPGPWLRVDVAGTAPDGKARAVKRTRFPQRAGVRGAGVDSTGLGV